ncbi:hypothetical protein CHS0354_043125 [Potamilus streckersoni]|uniref:AIG1-type G domain-containing protein n=1 Tax=Potamilus streckersoni TaxID=2493646 RepID=A0AAE0SBL6_9BIVA|nr:hypothetical protein CHS0354_043125 [Potamilus streckersoni]
MGSGKSFVCNILAGQDKFRSATSKNQGTVNVETERSIYQFKGCKDFFVTDTPDFQTPAGNNEVRKIQNTITYNNTFLVYVANWNHVLADLLGSSDSVEQQLGALLLDLPKFRGSVAVLTHVPKDAHDKVSSDKIYRYLDSKFKGNVETIIQDISLTDTNRSNTAQKIIRHFGLSLVEINPEKSLIAVDSRPDSTKSGDSLHSVHCNDNGVRKQDIDHKHVGKQTSKKEYDEF